MPNATTDQPVQKSPFRLARYIALLFTTELVRGDATKRKRFISRIARRVLQGLGIYSIAASFYIVFLAAHSLLKGPAEAKRQWRYRRWLWAVSGLDNRDYLRNWITQRYQGGPKIVVLGMGSIGDILQITPVLRALREQYPTADICLLHRSPAAAYVLKGNPHINAIGVADFYHFGQIKQSIATEGSADLAVEIQSISYIITYTRAPKEKCHPECDRYAPDEFFAKAEAELARWKTHPPVFPRKDDKFAWPEEWRGYQYLDVLGTTGNLPISRNSDLEFQIETKDSAVLGLVPAGQRYVTVQNGVDTDVMNWSRATGQRATKLMPLKTWVEMVKLLREQGFVVVQLGTPDDETIEGVTLDLRGKTSLREAAAIVREAVCHVGTEGGLVHLARAVNTVSVVMFGPTSVEFLGYPQNVNLVTSDCTSCWWTTRDWYIYCPRGLAEPECMHAHKASTIVDAVVKLAITEPGRRATV